MSSYILDNPFNVFIALLIAQSLAAYFGDFLQRRGRPIHKDERDLADTLKSGDVAPPIRDGQTVPTIVFHGDRDTTVHPRNGDQVIARSMRSTISRKTVHRSRVPGGYAYTRTIHTDPSGRSILEHWTIHGAGHAWSGGSQAGSYTDPRGPDAAKEMLRFFLGHSIPKV